MNKNNIILNYIAKDMLTKACSMENGKTVCGIDVFAGSYISINDVKYKNYANDIYELQTAFNQLEEQWFSK